jgi:hypothetical protein
MACLKNCEHERHLVYLDAFRVLSIFDYVEFMTRFVLDPNISSDDEDDLELFQDFVFGKFGRMHIYYYEHLFFKHPGKLEMTCNAYGRYVDFLGKISPIFKQEALSFLFQIGNIALIESVMQLGSHEVKMGVIQASDKWPHITKRVPKLKLYNLFS